MKFNPVWFVLLRYFGFPATRVFLLFGLTGSIAEMSLSPTNILGGLWFLVYGLMIYLPVYALPKARGAKSPRWWAPGSSHPAAPNHFAALLSLGGDGSSVLCGFSPRLNPKNFKLIGESRS